MGTGRACDGYESPFRTFTSQVIKNTHTAGTGPNPFLQPTKPDRPAFIEIAPQDIDLLNRCFSTKTLFDVKLGCYEEARQVLQASLTDPPLKNAISSLRALRDDLETSGDGPSVVEQTPGYHYGLQQYNLALCGLASNLSSPSSNALKSALLCCQIFISIEQVRKNYAAMAQHIIRGFWIMHEYHARPYLVAGNRLMPANHGQLPFLDVFIIKLFAAPCKFADSTPTSTCLTSSHQQPVESQNFRKIAPDTRTRLTNIAALSLSFLDKVSQVRAAGAAVQLLSEKAALLNSLKSWLIDLGAIQDKIEPPALEPIPVSFLRMLHLILKIVLMGALESSSDLDAELRTENDRLQRMADYVGERVRTFVTCNGRGDDSTSYMAKWRKFSEPLPNGA